MKKENKNSRQKKLYFFISAQSLMVSAFAVVIALHSDHFRLSAPLKIAFGIMLAVIFILTLYSIKEITRIIKNSEDEADLLEKNYRDEIDSVVYALPENSSIVSVNLAEDRVTGFHGEHEAMIASKLASGKITGAMDLCRELLFFSQCCENQKDEILSVLDCKVLSEKYRNNEKKFRYTYSIVPENGCIEVRELCIHLFRNPSTDEIDAVFHASDISDEYYKNLVGTFLATKQYFFTTLIFINNGKGRSLANNTDMGKENKFYDYDFFLDDICSGLIDVNERDEFRQKMTLDTIKKEMNENNYYQVYVHIIGMHAMKRYVKYEFHYVDENRESVLLTVSDVTPVWETDSLTGLSNYKGFISQSKYLLENSSMDEEYSVIVTNIKWFKVINKIFGSARCDEFLREYSRILKNSDLKPLEVGRFPASDHFILLVKRDNITDDKLMRITHQHIETAEREVDVMVTCGIYNISDRKVPVSDMVEHAITAFKGIRDIYNVPYATFSEKEEELYLSGKMVVSEFEKALREKEFQPFYQPIYDSATHKIVSAEALVRWKKDGSFISPGMFIPALEENGSVSRLDMYISGCVTDFLKRRKLAGNMIVPVSVNLSVMDFYASEAMDGVMEHIDTMLKHSIVPRYEITETAWSDSSDNRNEIIENMRAKGTQILIDDFGSGYSSFSTVRDFSFDILKIDMGFVRKIGLNQKADGIVSSIIDMAHFIGLKVVAEGVESKEHLDFLTEHGCDYIQGYYFSKPLPEEEFERLLDEQEKKDA